MELNEIRNEIDNIDNQLLKLFIERMNLSGEVAKYKEEHNLPIMNKSREREILADVMKKSGNMDVYAHRLFASIMELSRSYQGQLISTDSNVGKIIKESLTNASDTFPKSATVACQGIEGSYSQEAADKIFPMGSLTYLKTFDAIFDAVESGLCQYGILPIENSSNGSVRAVYDLLGTRNVNIVRSERICIRHELLAKPGTKLSDIKEIYSHEQAIGQCSEFIKNLGDSVKIIPVANTAIAAQMVSKSTNPGVASISSHDCGALYALEPISTKIQNSDNNYTRFICITKKPKAYPGANKISLILTCQHKPGALYEILAQLSALEINLLKLESCPIVGHDFEFTFFFDIEASVYDERTVSMLEWLERNCDSFKYLGNYSEA